MGVIKYTILFGWSLILLSLVIFIIRSHPFIRRKKDEPLNCSEAIYIISLLVSATLVMIPLLEALAMDYDITNKFYPEKFGWTLISSGSLISLAGMSVFVLYFIAGRGLSTFFFFGRNPLIEFNVNNIAYSLIRGGLLLSVSLLLSPLLPSAFQLLLPAITAPFYR